MNDFSNAIAVAWELVIGLDADLVEIVVLSLKISLSAVLIATLVALPLGAAVAVFRFPGRGACIVVLNALMGLPPVAVGLLIYLLLSRAGPLGEHGLLYTPAAMVIAQAVLVVPIIAALAQQVLSELYGEYEEQLRSLGVSSARAIPTLLWDGRFSLLIAVLAGFGRASEPLEIMEDAESAPDRLFVVSGSGDGAGSLFSALSCKEPVKVTRR